MIEITWLNFQIYGSCFIDTFIKTTDVVSLSDDVMMTLAPGSNITLLIAALWMLAMWRQETMLSWSSRSFWDKKMEESAAAAGQSSLNLCFVRSNSTEIAQHKR